jgi:hypothetical protein
MERFIALTESELEELISRCSRSVLIDFYNEINKDQTDRLYSFNAAAKKLGVSWTTVRKMVEHGVLFCTVNPKRIPERSLRDYLKSNKVKNNDNS